MGDVLRFPTPENQVLEVIENLLEAARDGTLVTFVYLYQDQDGEFTYDWAGELDVEQIRLQLMDLRRALRVAKE